MRWRKLGKVFDPASVKLPAGCVEFAQAPQALPLGDIVRIYFSTRSVDGGGKYLSHVAFADFDRTLRKVVGLATEPVMSLGNLGAFDEHGIFPMSILRRTDEIWGYTCGWSRRSSVPVETAIGLAVSRDNGLTFTRVGPGPVLAASRNEPFLVGDGFVIEAGGNFHMWYIFGTGWARGSAAGPPERTYKIGHATSKDGIAWIKEDGRQIVPDVLGPQEAQALPSVVEIDGLYHMFFCYRDSFGFRNGSGHGYRIGHAFSADLSTWTRDDTHPQLNGGPSDWDSRMQCYPNVFELDGSIFLLYNGNDFGRGGFGAAVLER